ncbi:MAG: hypothetical protein CMH54_13960 [Myxococcales bacterium]|nr:hypothetical protein [Myxococcales bacterium]
MRLFELHVAFRVCSVLFAVGSLMACGGAVDGPVTDQGVDVVDGFAGDGGETSAPDVPADAPVEVADADVDLGDTDIEELKDWGEDQGQDSDSTLVDPDTADTGSPSDLMDVDTGGNEPDVLLSDSADTGEPDVVVVDATPPADLPSDAGGDAIGNGDGDVLEPDSADTGEAAIETYERTVHFSEAGLADGEFATLFTQVISLPPDFETVEAQIAIRGDLDAFPMAFMALLVEQEDGVSQCGDLAGLPQKPNNILDDVYRVAFPRPENLDPSSIYFPPAPPYDYQPIPCQEAFQGKTEIIIGIVVAGIYPPGLVGNQGPSACGGEGCPNDAIVKLRFLPGAGETEVCDGEEVGECVCSDGTYGSQICVDGLWGECACETGPVEPACTPGMVESCLCDDGLPGARVCNAGVWDPCQCTPGSNGSCNAPQAFSIGPDHPQVVLSNPATALHAVPWPPFELACPTSKPPFALEYYYEMSVTSPGNISVTYEAIPEPWEINQFWIDMLQSCTTPYQCNQSYQPLEGYADVGQYIIGLTLAPLQEIFIPEQDWWNFAITVTWSEATPP